jgi:antitoxin (DNA-binding transcriptional repressor) of toxin-antitoxin stability system
VNERSGVDSTGVVLRFDPHDIRVALGARSTASCGSFFAKACGSLASACRSASAARLAAVHNGGTVTVLDRDTAVARIVPIAVPSLEIRRAKRRLRDLKLPSRPSKRTDSSALLVDDRRRR